MSNKKDTIKDEKLMVIGESKKGYTKREMEDVLQLDSVNSAKLYINMILKEFCTIERNHLSSTNIRIKIPFLGVCISEEDLKIPVGKYSFIESYELAIVPGLTPWYEYDQDNYDKVAIIFSYDQIRITYDGLNYALYIDNKDKIVIRTTIGVNLDLNQLFSLDKKDFKPKSYGKYLHEQRFLYNSLIGAELQRYFTYNFDSYEEYNGSYILETRDLDDGHSVIEARLPVFENRIIRNNAISLFNRVYYILKSFEVDVNTTDICLITTDNVNTLTLSYDLYREDFIKDDSFKVLKLRDKFKHIEVSVFIDIRNTVYHLLNRFRPFFGENNAYDIYGNNKDNFISKDFSKCDINNTNFIRIAVRDGNNEIHEIKDIADILLEYVFDWNDICEVRKVNKRGY